jgi:hypothetical protein
MFIVVAAKTNIKIRFSRVSRLGPEPFFPRQITEIKESNFSAEENIVLKVYIKMGYCEEL